MWNSEDLQNSISKQILTWCCRLAVFWNYLSHSQPWNAFEKPVVRFSRWNSWACSAYQACWERTAVLEKRAKLRNARTPGWTSAERPVRATQIDEQEKRFRRPFQRCPGAVTRGSGRLREEEGTLKTALRSPLTAAPPPYQTSFTPPYVLWLYSLVLADGLFLYNISNWNISLWTESRIRKGPIHSQLVLCTKKNPTQTKRKLTRPIMAIFAKVGFWKHKTKCHPPRHKGHIPDGEL